MLPMLFRTAVTICILTALTLPVVAGAASLYEVSDTSAWNIRINGATEGDWAGYGDPVIADVDGNGRNDLLIQSWWADRNGRDDSGSLYLLYDSLLDDYSGTGNAIDLFSTYNVRFDGASTTDYLSVSAVTVGDFDNDDAADILVGAYGADPYGRSGAGSLYVIDSNIFSGLTGTGNNIDMAASSSYTVRFDAAAAGDMLTFSNGLALADIDGNGNNDLLIGARDADNNGRTYSGSIYILYDSLLGAYSGTGTAVDLASTTLFNIRLDGSASTELFGNGPFVIEDFDDNDTPDLMLSAYGRDNTYADGGSVYFIKNELLDGLTGVGNIVDMASSTTFTTRYDMVSRHAIFGGDLGVGDFDDDGAPDLLVGAIGADHGGNTVQGTGWAYILKNTLIDDYTGTDNVVEIGTSSPTTNYNLRFLGEGITQHFGSSVAVADMDRDGADDFFLSGRFVEGETDESLGGTYFFDSDSFSGISGTGNDINITDVDAYAARWEGFTGSQFGQGTSVGDLNDDGRPDVVMEAYAVNVEGRNNAGTLYVVFNFPHTILASVASAETATTTYSLSGTADATGSVSAITGVEYALNSNSPDGTWTACTADDGTFDEAGPEAFTCSLSGVSEGSHTIYLRAYDENGWYTDQSDYGSQILTADFTPEEEEEEENNGGGGGGGGGSSRAPSNDIEVFDLGSLTPGEREELLEELKQAVIALMMQLIELLREEIESMTA